MKRFVWFLFSIILATIVNSKSETNTTLTIDDIFPTDRVLDVQITLKPTDWDTIRFQSREFAEALSESRQYAPPDHPYTYVDSSVSIDGVEFSQVGIRKKGFIGSQNTDRPSLKIKLNHINKDRQIDGLTNLTFNNNQQDLSLISQFMGYGLFNAVGSPAPRCAYANLTVNGQNLGIYTHVERIHRPLLKRSFSNDQGVLYEGTVVDFYSGWVDSFEHKFGSKKKGRKRIKDLIQVLHNPEENIETAIGKLVDLDAFYRFWALEGLLSFWDGYSGNANNYFFYLHPEIDKFYFIPWGADSLFERYSPIRDDSRDPISVKIQGLIANRLYQIESGRQHYRQTLKNIMEQHWNDKALLAETERIEALLKPYLAVGEEIETQTDPIKKIVETENKEKDDEAEKGKFIVDWFLLGPFYTKERHGLAQDFLLQHGGEDNIYPDKKQEFINSKNQPLRWRSVSAKNEIINLVKEVGRFDDVTAYAFTEIESDQDRYVEFGLGSDDSVKVWINGYVVHQYEEARDVEIDQDRFIVKLNSGKNRCLIKISQGMGGWGFAIRPVASFSLDEGILLSGQLILEGENRDDFPPIRLQAKINSGGSTYSRDLGFLVPGQSYQRIIRIGQGARLKSQQAVSKGAVLAERDMESRSDQEIDLIINTESSLALKVFNLGLAQSHYEFVEALTERREFIQKRDSQIVAEITDGMPKWEFIPPEPWALTSIFGTPFPLNNWQNDQVFGNDFPFRNWSELLNFTRLVFLGVVALLCSLHLFSRRYSIYWYLQVLKKYLVFNGRSRRNEFWVFQVFNVLVSIIFPVIAVNLVSMMGGDLEIIVITYGLSMGIYSLGIIIPSLAVSVRRLHDVGRSGWWLIIGLIPIVGWILTLIWYVSDSEAEENKYGPNPK